MEVIAITRNARMSAFKGRPLCRACQGLKASDALKIVEFSPKKAAEIIRKTLKSAIANASANNGVADPGSLYVRLCVRDATSMLVSASCSARPSGFPSGRFATVV